MKCFLCEKELCEGSPVGFVCICNKCIEMWEKLEARMVNMITSLRKEAADLIVGTNSPEAR
ncbi:hypothetical protein LCGC14_2028030 [marine sediment metagenome]|uniref:Uncharacterized protein n=1 Tax=marine sediment metagenome TaxID=412755 RepID=A0A0F9EVK8_9ZZZZ